MLQRQESSTTMRETLAPGPELSAGQLRGGPASAPLRWRFHGRSGGLRWSAESDEHRFCVHVRQTDATPPGALLRVLRLDTGALVIHQYTLTTERAVEMATWLHGGG